MARKRRVWYPGAMYHITARGNRRAAIFRIKHDYEMYLTLLQEVRNKYPYKLHAYCLMTNHLHLQIETISDHIQYIMKDLHSNYAIYFNKRLKIDGHVFQGRYGAQLIEDDAYFLEVSRYIHRNPLEAKMVKKLEEYPWSSYSAYIYNEANPYIDKSKTYAYFPDPNHLYYQRFVESNADVKDMNVKEDITWEQLLQV